MINANDKGLTYLYSCVYCMTGFVGVHAQGIYICVHTATMVVACHGEENLITFALMLVLGFRSKLSSVSEADKPLNIRINHFHIHGKCALATIVA